MSVNPNVRTAWRVVGSAVAVAALASLTWNTVDAAASRRETRTRSVAADGIARLVVEAESGDVTVVGRAGAERIDVSARVRAGLFEPTFSVERSGDALRVAAECVPMSTTCVDHVTVTVPTSLVVEITSENGDLDVRGTDGRAELTTNNGDIAARDLGGPLVVRTDNGEVQGLQLRSASVDAASDNGSLRMWFDSIPTRIVVDSDNGDVDVSLPAEADRTGVDFALTATSDNGSVTTPIRTNPTSRRSIGATSDNGDVTVAYRR